MTLPGSEGWRQVAGPGFPAGLGPLWTRRLDEGWEYGVVLTPDHANATGAIHGGVLLALMDHTLSLTVWEATGRKPCVTIQLGMQFLRAAAPGMVLRARGRVTRLTRSLAFAHGEPDTGATDLAASAEGVWRILGGA